MLINRKGVSLIELLAAVTLIVIVVATASYFLPKAMTNAASSRYLTTAKNIAAGEIQTLKQRPYDNIPAQTAATFAANFQVLIPPDTNCDCSKFLPGQLQTTQSTTTVVNGVTYYTNDCIDLESRASGAAIWTPFCSDGTNLTDTGLKHIRVTVTWTAHTLGVQQGSLVKGGTAGITPDQQAADLESVVIRQ